MEKQISVIMPVYNQDAFICRAIRSLLEQTYPYWELIIINDGCTDRTEEYIQSFLEDSRIRYLKNEKNRGVGYSLNKGLEVADYDTIAYLPADDVWYPDHLESLTECLEKNKADLVYSGIVHDWEGAHNYGKESKGKIDKQPLQLVQVMHRKTGQRWMERNEFVTDNLDMMFWDTFVESCNMIACTDKVTCEWVAHPYQRHKIINDSTGGGLYLYKRYYGVIEPLVFKWTYGNLTDEKKHYERFRTPCVFDEQKGLKIVLVGELSYNPERIYAFEQKGHKLYGLWMNNPVNFNSIGPFPFGNVETIPFDNWQERVKEIQPDIIYAGLNYHAIPIAYHVLKNNPGIPFVWHFKEGPTYSKVHSTWNYLMELYNQADGRIYINKIAWEWFSSMLKPGPRPELVLDGDLPHSFWFEGERTPLLSEHDGEIHTIIPGRPLGMEAQDFKVLADQKIHAHIYGDVFHNQSREMIEEAQVLAKGYIHLHPNCPSEDWLKEFSQYDAGWMHKVAPQNQGNLLKCNWVDLNSPARMSTYAIAGLPMLIQDYTGHYMASSQYLDELGVAIKYKSVEELGELFKDKERIATIRENIWKKRDQFCFDTHLDDLIAFFRQVIKSKQS